MSDSPFHVFFQAATGFQTPPYDYQSRLAESACESCLITIPTGFGKTARRRACLALQPRPQA